MVPEPVASITFSDLEHADPTARNPSRMAQMPGDQVDGG
jgi:hypothetical protein